MADSKLWRSTSSLRKGKKSVPLTPSNVMRALRELEEGKWWEDWGLGPWLSIPHSKRTEIRRNFPSAIDQKKQCIYYWMQKDPLATWRRLINILYVMRETKLAYSIRSNAEPLTDDASLPPHTLQNIVTSVREFWGIGLLFCLGVPYSVQDLIRDSSAYSSEEERRVATLEYYLQTMPGAAWGRVAGVLWCLGEHTALEAVRQYLPRKHDPSLDLPNMQSALNTLPDTEWRHFGVQMNVPLLKLNEIESQYSTNGEMKAAVFSVYLTEHPQPTWDYVADFLYQLSGGKYHSVLDRLQSMFPTGRNRARQIYNEEMKHGSSKRIITKVVLVGIAGSGKSTSLETVMEEKPPAEEDRESTPLLKRPVQTEVINIDNHLKWIKKSPEEVRQHVAGLLRDRARRLGKTSATASDTASNATPTPATPTTVQSTPVQPVASSHHSSSATPLTSTPATAASELLSSSAGPKVTLESLLQSSELDEEFISLLNVPGDSPETVLTERWVYLVDSGGQPEFTEAMTVFLGRMSACIYVLDLSQSLDHHPLIAYYRKGKPISKPYPCVRSNEDNFKQCMRTMHSFTSKTKGPPPKLLFLGTHRDKIHKCTSETVEEKNKRLKKIIPLKFKGQIIQFNKDKLIFEINAQNPDDTDKNTAERVRCYITDQCPTVEIEIPMRWHSFDQMLRSIAERLGRMVMSRHECRQVAESLGLDEQSFDGALDFFHSVSLIFYFRYILPAVVFVDPQVMLDKVSELVEFMFKLREPADQENPSPDTRPADAGQLSTKSPSAPSDAASSAPEKPSSLFSDAGQRSSKQKLHIALHKALYTLFPKSQNQPTPTALAAPSSPEKLSSNADEPLLPPGWQQFNKFGQVTKPFLKDKRFSAHYHAGIFTSDDLITLLEELLVFAKLSTDAGQETWFMPSVLKQLSTEKIGEVCVSAIALVVDFPDGGPQNGICCSLMSHVLSPENCHPCPWKLRLSPDKDEPACLHRNCIQFEVPRYAGSVTLIDHYEYFEVHVNTLPHELQELWQHVQNAIFSGIEVVSDTLGYSNNKPRPAIVCPLTHTDKSHPAYLKGQHWICTRDGEKFGTLTDDIPWLKTSTLPSSSGAVHPPTAPHIPLPPSSNTVYTMYLHSQSQSSEATATCTPRSQPAGIPSSQPLGPETSPPSASALSELVTGPVSPSPPPPHSTSAPTPPDKLQQGRSLSSAPELLDLMTEVAADIPDKWWEVAVGLRLERGDIRRIETDEQKCIKRFMAVFDTWKRTETEPHTWKTIIDCLDSRLVNEKRLAKEILARCVEK